MSEEICSSGSERSEVRRSVRSTAGNRLRELIRLELKRKQNERYLQDTFEGMQSEKDGMELLISDNNSILEGDESEYSTEASSDDIIDSDFDDSANEDGSVSGQETELEPQSKRKRSGKRVLTRSTSHPTKLVTTPTNNNNDVITSKKKKADFPNLVTEGKW